MGILKKGTKYYSVFNNKCPRCQEGDFWKSRKPLKNYFQKNSMHETCECCELIYTKELGFWYGAMYVSYGMNVLLFVLTAGFIYLISHGEASAISYIWIIILSSLIMAPIFYYYARLIWINLFSRYDPRVKCVDAKVSS